MRLARSLALFAWASSLTGCAGLGQHLSTSSARSTRGAAAKSANLSDSEKNGAKEEAPNTSPPVPLALYIAEPPGNSASRPPQLRLVSTEESTANGAAMPPSVGTASPTTPTTTPQETQPVSHDEKLQLLNRQAVRRVSLMDTYQFRMRRRESVASKPRQEELIECKFRQTPYSVHMKWVGGEGKGREVIYVNGQNDSLIHTLTADGDVPLLGGGKRFKISPDSMMVKNRSRHSIKEAGIETSVARFGKQVEEHVRGKPSLRYVGLLKRPEFEQRVECVFQTIAPKCEATLPNGGQRLWFFDTDLGLPVLIVSLDDQKREVEYYCFDRFQYPSHLTDNDFNPDRVWR